MHAVFHITSRTALPDGAGPTKLDKPFPLAPAAVGVDVFGFEMESVFLRIQSAVFSLAIIFGLLPAA